MSDTQSPFGGHVTPTHGDMDSSQHAAFMLRVFQYLVCISPQMRLEVDLRDVLEATKDTTIMVGLDGPKFTAIALHKAPPMKGGKFHGH